jgi:hypothetical protein
MDYQNINKETASRLLDKYWMGETSLEEEASLRRYFKSNHLAEEHQQFAPLFSYFNQTKNQPKGGDTKVIEMQPKRKGSYRNWLSAAATVLLLIGTTFILWQKPQPSISPETMAATDNYAAEKQATFEEAKAALMLVSNKINKGNQKAINEIKSIRK